MDRDGAIFRIRGLHLQLDDVAERPLCVGVDRDAGQIHGLVSVAGEEPERLGGGVAVRPHEVDGLGGLVDGDRHQVPVRLAPNRTYTHRATAIAMRAMSCVVNVTSVSFAAGCCWM